MAEEIVKDEAGDVVHDENGDPQNNMIIALTSFILEHCCGAKSYISYKHSLILMNFKCKKMSQYEDFDRDWIQILYEVKDSKNLLWKQVYLEAFPSKCVYYLKIQ